jgi:hypothetical protein
MDLKLASVTDIPLLPRGIGLTCALFIEAHGWEHQQLNIFRHHQFWYKSEASSD